MTVNINLKQLKNKHSIIQINIDNESIVWKAKIQRGQDKVVNGKTYASYNAIYQPLLWLLIKKYLSDDGIAEDDIKNGLPLLKQKFSEEDYNKLLLASNLTETVVGKMQQKEFGD